MKGSRDAFFICIRCGQGNGVFCPAKKDFTPSQLGQMNRMDPPLSYVSQNLTMFVGLRKCKICGGYSVVVFYGWYFGRGAFSYLPWPNDRQGSLGPEVAKWVIEKMKGLGVKIPKDLEVT
jgi:hypothetical protein